MPVGNGKQRWQKVVSILKRFTTPRARELERQLSEVRNDYRELGLRASALAGEGDNARASLEKAQQHIDSIHSELDSAYKDRGHLAERLQEQITSLKRELEQAHERQAELVSALSARDQQLETLATAAEARLSGEQELRESIDRIQQQLRAADLENADVKDTNLRLTTELETLRQAFDETQNAQTEQLADLRQPIADSDSLVAALNSVREEQERQAQKLEAQLTTTQAELNRFQVQQSELRTQQTANDQQLQALQAAGGAHRQIERELLAGIRSLERRTDDMEDNDKVTRDRHQTLAVELESDRKQLAGLELKLGDIEAERTVTQQRISTLDRSLADTASRQGDTQQRVITLEDATQQRDAHLNTIEERLARVQIEQESLLNSQSGMADSLRKNRQWTVAAAAVALLVGALAGAAMFKHSDATSRERAALIDDPNHLSEPQVIAEHKAQPGQQPASADKQAAESAALETETFSADSTAADAGEVAVGNQLSTRGETAIDSVDAGIGETPIDDAQAEVVPRPSDEPMRQGEQTDAPILGDSSVASMHSQTPTEAEAGIGETPIGEAKAEIAGSSTEDQIQQPDQPNTPPEENARLPAMPPLTSVEALATAQDFNTKAFFEENARKEGVISLPSWLQYRVLKSGHGNSPGPADMVILHYRGSLPDGRIFDSSYADRAPAAYRVNEVIAGWREALQQMQEGAEWELYIPPQLAHYAEEGEIPGFLPLIYRIQLISVSNMDAFSRSP
jgi:FKBP-type peptidyl-prolyl cis-trans isomerase